MRKSNYLLPITICALLLFVALAPEIKSFDQVFQRAFFTLAAAASGYFILRYRMRSRHYRRLKMAFSKREHRKECRWRFLNRKRKLTFQTV